MSWKINNTNSQPPPLGVIRDVNKNVILQQEQLSQQNQPQTSALRTEGPRAQIYSNYSHHLEQKIPGFSSTIATECFLKQCVMWHNEDHSQLLPHWQIDSVTLISDVDLTWTDPWLTVFLTVISANEIISDPNSLTNSKQRADLSATQHDSTFGVAAAYENTVWSSFWTKNVFVCFFFCHVNCFVIEVKWLR